MLTVKLENILLAHEDGVYRFSARSDCDALVSEVFAALRESQAENAELREALGNISRMRTMPDHKTNTFTLVMAHKLAEQALAYHDIARQNALAAGSTLDGVVT